jgi:hypothetical protein
LAAGEDLVMPRSLASGPSPTQELRHFTNREQERQVLSRLLSLPSGNPLPVVMFYGVGGTGKSWLLRRLRADVPPEIPTADGELSVKLAGDDAGFPAGELSGKKRIDLLPSL